MSEVGSGYTFWNLGDYETVRMSDKNLAKILRAILVLKGRVWGSSIDNRESGKSGRSTFSMRISLPDGKAQEFMDMTGVIIQGDYVGDYPYSSGSHEPNLEEEKPFYYKSENLIISDDTNASIIPNFS